MTQRELIKLKNADVIRGKSAYEVACDNGYVGTQAQWLESLKGSSDITVDTEIIESSPNPVSGGAVYTAVGNIEVLLAAL